ncbi:MAG: AAA family ATPase [Deltaproteobacteria bacterium]|jgi:hypothetical protein|nr:AAA family ATPase [Deltaproteobacteria bacterium]
MRLTALTIKNFKSIDEEGIRLEFSPITLLFGQNNAGKSSVIQALHLLREVLVNNNPAPDQVEGGGQTINLGGFQEFVHRHDLSRTVRIGLEIDSEGKDLSAFLRPNELKWQEFGEYIETKGREFRESFETEGQTKPTESGIYRQNLESLTFDGQFRPAWELAQKALNRVSGLGLEIGLSWDPARKRAFVSNYAVTMNGQELGGLTCQENGVQLFKGLEFSNFLSPQEKELCRQYIKANLPADDGNYGEILEGGAGLPEVVKLLSNIIDFKATWEALAPGSTFSDYGQAEPMVINPELIGSALPLWANPLDLSEITSSNVCAFFLSSLLVGPGLWLREYLQSSLLYIGPLRTRPPRNFLPGKTVIGECWANGLAAWDKLAVAETYELELLNRWLTGEASLQTGYTIFRKNILTLNADSPLTLGLSGAAVGSDLDEAVWPPLGEFQSQASETGLVFRNQTSGLEVCPQDMGLGLSQIMPVLVVGALPEAEALISIEQPELNIHPAWQATLGDIFLKAVTKENPPLFLLETHSEHLMLRILRRIRETNEGELPPEFPAARPEMVSVLYFQPKEDSRTEIIRIPVTPDGDFGRKWPGGFFAERAKELF